MECNQCPYQEDCKLRGPYGKCILLENLETHNITTNLRIDYLEDKLDIIFEWIKKNFEDLKWKLNNIKSDK